MTPDSLSTLIVEFKWPLVIVIVLVLFRRPLQAVIERLTNLTVSAGSFRLETALRGHVSPDIIRQVSRRPAEYGLQGDLRQITILRLETRGYTSIEETVSPEQAVEYLQRYLSEMTDVVFASGGTIDHYDGTALTAYWGAPIDISDAPARACKAALAMCERVRKLSPELEAVGFPPLLPLVAITTARVMVGDFGSRQKPNYSLVGDYQSILDGLVRLNYNYRTHILVTRFTHEYVQDDFEFRLLHDHLITRGKQEPIAVYELLDG